MSALSHAMNQWWLFHWDLKDARDRVQRRETSLRRNGAESRFRHLFGRPQKPQTGTMNEIQELRDALGPIAEIYNETQLRQLSREIDLMAEFLLDLYVSTHSQKPRRETTRFDGNRADP